MFLSSHKFELLIWWERIYSPVVRVLYRPVVRVLTWLANVMDFIPGSAGLFFNICHLYNLQCWKAILNAHNFNFPFSNSWTLRDSYIYVYQISQLLSLSLPWIQYFIQNRMFYPYYNTLWLAFSQNYLWKNS